MQYTDLQISAIKLFGRKELSFGCIFKYWDIYTRYCHPWTSFHIVQKLNADTYAIWNEDFKKIEILWHEPHLFPDVARVAEEKWFSVWVVERKWVWYISIGKIDNPNIVINQKFIPSKPLIEQSESTLEKLISLFE